MKRFLILSTIIALATPSLRGGDTVYLRTGELLAGKILRLNDREVSIQLESGGVVSFRLQQVKRVRRWVPGQGLPQVIDFDEEGSAAPRQTETPPGHNPIRIPELGPEDLRAGADAAGHDPTIVEPSTGPEAAGALSTAETASSDAVWHLAPPVGFERLSAPVPEEVVESWVEPVSQAVVTLAVYPVAEGVEDFKRLLLTRSPGVTRPRIYRDLPLRRDGAGGFRGWILEIEQDFPAGAIRQVNLLARGEGKTYVLRCTSLASRYQALANSFEASLHSFRVHEGNAATTSGG